MVTSQSAVGEAAEGVDGISDVLIGINKAVVSESEMNQKIAAASAEQTAVSDTLSERIESINRQKRWRILSATYTKFLKFSTSNPMLCNKC